MSVDESGAGTESARAEMLLGAMSLSDKIAMTYQQYPLDYHYGAAGYIPGNASLCIPDLVFNDAGQGVWDTSGGAWAVAPGDYTVSVGDSSASLPPRGILTRSSAGLPAGAY